MSGAKPLRIGMVTWDYDPPIGGMGRHVSSLQSGFESLDHTVSVFSRSDIRFPFGRSILFSLLLPLLLPRWIKRFSPDLLHVHAGPGGVFLLRKPALLPLMVTANHTYHDQVRCVGQRWKRLLVPLERRTYALADHILCLSEDTAHSLLHDYGIDRSKLSVVPCGIDVARFSALDRPLRDRGKRCVFVGRSDARKGFDLLLHAWPLVLRTIPDATLHAVGIGSDFSLPLPPAVVLHPACTDDELAELLGSSRVSVCPSRLEGFGLAAAEAIASGTPVVATDVPGLRTTVTNFETGLLTSMNPHDIASTLVSLLQDDVLWHRFHVGCQRRRLRFDVKLEIQKHLEVYRVYTDIR